MYRAAGGSKDEIKFGRTPLSLAACLGETESTRTMMNVFGRVLSSKQQARRQAPLLRKQPESYFSNIECGEKEKVDTSIQVALVSSLFLGWRDSKSEITAEDDNTHPLNRLSSSLTLFKKGVLLDEASFALLKSSIA
eukprot:223011-Ditylum_brightwellii.AAC.1